MSIKIPDQDCNELRTACDKIAKETETTITLTEPAPQSSFTSHNAVNILITGIPDQAENARVKILVMLDKQVINRTYIYTHTHTQTHTLIHNISHN